MVDTLIEQVRASAPKMVVVHPTVLLSVVDHYNRIARDTKKRVVGVLLGEYGPDGLLDVTNCYAVPFDEDLNEPQVWFFDHIYHETMFNMMRKIHSKERIIGWYSSGPAIKKADIDINEILRKYNTNPVFVLIKVHEAAAPGIPTEAYCTQEEVDDNGNLMRQFVHIPSSIGASEAEEVGVEHLLRDIKDASQGQLSKQVGDKIQALKALTEKLKEMRVYLQNVLSGKFRYNHAIIHNFQDIFNLLPNLKVDQVVKNFSVKTNDYMHVIYISTLIRSVISLHNLINNKISTKEIEIENTKREEDIRKKREEESRKKVEDALKRAEAEDDGKPKDAPQ
jgi:26S proteasome regulatory subunit N8